MTWERCDHGSSLQESPSDVFTTAPKCQQLRNVQMCGASFSGSLPPDMTHSNASVSCAQELCGGKSVKRVVKVRDTLQHKGQEPGRKAGSPAQALQEAS